MSKLTILFLGLAAGYAVPLLINVALFGTVMPCHTVKHYEDGSSIQACEVRG